MSGFRWYVVRRLGTMVVTAWLVLTLAFVLFTIKPDPNKALVLFGAGPSAEAQREALQAYIEAHNYDVPVLQRYVKWMGNYATLRWGTTLQGIPIAALIGDALAETLTYLVPSLLVSTVVAHALGVYMAFHRGGWVDKLGNVLAYAGYGVPAFFAAELTFGWLLHSQEMLWLAEDSAMAHEGVPVPPAVDQYLLPFAILTVHLIAVQLVFIRSAVVEELTADFMKTLRASGAGPLDLVRHALRNAAIPLVSSFFAQLLTFIYLDVIAIEVAIGPGGFGQLTFSAFTNQDLGLILGVSIVPIAIGLVGNFVQDLAYTALDPRVEVTGGGVGSLGRRLPLPDLTPRAQWLAAGVAVLVVVGVVGGVAGPGALGFGGDGADAGPSATPEPGIDVRVGYSGPWVVHLEVTVNNSVETREIRGDQNRVVEIDPDAARVHVTARKRDDGQAKLTLQVVHDGEIVDSESTTEAYGAVRAVAEF